MHNLYLRRLHVIKSTRRAAADAAAGPAVGRSVAETGDEASDSWRIRGRRGTIRGPPIGLEEKSNRDALSPGAR